MAFPERCPLISEIKDNPQTLAECRDAQRIWQPNLPVLGKAEITQGEIEVEIGSERSFFNDGWGVTDGVLETIKVNFCGEECPFEHICKLEATPISLGGVDVVYKVVIENKARIR